MSGEEDDEEVGNESNIGKSIANQELDLEGEFAKALAELGGVPSTAPVPLAAVSSNATPSVPSQMSPTSIPLSGHESARNTYSSSF